MFMLYAPPEPSRLSTIEEKISAVELYDSNPKWSFAKVASITGVPTTVIRDAKTLLDSGTPLKSVGRPRALNPYDEKVLAAWAKWVWECRTPQTKLQIRKRALQLWRLRNPNGIIIGGNLSFISYHQEQ